MKSDQEFKRAVEEVINLIEIAQPEYFLKPGNIPLTILVIL
jgi:hypothetical protein